MAKWARVVDRVVQETWQTPDSHPDLTAPGLFGDAVPGTWIECPDEVMGNWTYSEADGFAAPVPNQYPAGTPIPPITKRQFLCYALDQGKSEEDVVAALEDKNGSHDIKIMCQWDYPDNMRFSINDPVIVALDNAGFFAPLAVESWFWNAAQATT